MKIDNFGAKKMSVRRTVQGAKKKRKKRLPLEVAFYDMQGMQWDYSNPVHTRVKLLNYYNFLDILIGLIDREH